MDDLWGGGPESHQFNDLTLEDKPLFDHLFTRFPLKISEFTFTNLFIWRRACQTGISRFRGLFCFLSDQEVDSFFFSPVGEEDVIECCQSLLHYPGERVALPKIARCQPGTEFRRRGFEEGKGVLFPSPPGQQVYDYF